MKNIIVRNIKEEDIESVIEIRIKGWQDAYKNIIDEEHLNKLNNDYDRRINHLKETYMENGFIVAELNNKVVGFCRYVFNNKFSPEIENADCEISAIYVKPELKGNGIGTKLFKYVVEEFKKENKKHMILWCLKDNEKSKKFYNKMGGKIIKERKVKIGNKDYLEICFSYNI